MKLKALFITFRGLSIKQITQIFMEGENPTLKSVIVVIFLHYKETN